VRGRYHLWSDDGGRSWAGPLEVARPDEIGGFAGPASLLLDSAGTVHAVFAGLGGEGEAIWYSVWNGVTWREPQMLSADLPHSEKASATMVMGHQIHAVWIEFRSRDIWTSWCDTGASPLPLKPLQRRPVDHPTAAPESVVEAMADGERTEAGRSTPGPTAILPSAELGTDVDNEIPPFAAGAIAALVVVGAVVGVQAMRRGRR
jgi:hypothetical protein